MSAAVAATSRHVEAPVNASPTPPSVSPGGNGLLSMGHQRNSPGYFERGRDMLELDSARVTGVAYDPNTQALTADEAAKISGLSEKSYADAYRQLKAQGRVK